jgi:DNA-binding response OmpR family regulator
MRLLVVEDEKDLNHIIVKKLEAEGYSVDYCYDGESAVDYLLAEEYDGVILDIMLPKLDGFQVLKKVRRAGVQVPALYLSARDQTSDIVNGLDIGADDYMVKPFVFAELLARIRVMTRKTTDIHENVYRCGDLVVDCNTHVVYRANIQIGLSPKEFSILVYLIRNKNIVVTREQIESNIWRFDYNGSSNVVDVYIRYLRKKIDEGCEHKMIHTIRGAGYMIKCEE